MVGQSRGFFLFFWGLPGSFSGWDKRDLKAAVFGLRICVSGIVGSLLRGPPASHWCDADLLVEALPHGDPGMSR